MKNRFYYTLLATMVISLLLCFRITSFGVEEQASLYYGANVEISYDGDTYPLVDLRKDRYVIIVDGKEKTLSQTTTIQVRGSLKFDTRYVTIEDTSHTIENLYHQRLSEEYNQLQSLQMSSANMSVDNTSTSFDYDDRLMELDMEMAEALANPDTIRAKVTFTPNWIHDDVFLFGLAHFTINGDVASRGIKGRMVEVDDLIPGDTQTLSFDITSMPEGFNLSKVSYHFYSKGVEIPTNLSEKRRLLNEEETYQFFMLQYMSANEGKTRGPSLYEPLAKEDIYKYLREDQIKNVVLTVLIDETGKTKEVTIKSGLTEFQKEICELARQVQFFPTLKDGEPIEKEINVRLSQIIL